MDEKYNTLIEEYENEIVEKKSRFICFLIPIKTEVEAKEKLEAIKKRYYDARHHCSAYIINSKPIIERCNDDGEPAGTAGMPMLEVLRGKNIRNVLAVVVRYFGGTLLGTGGLIRAYTSSVQQCIEVSNIVEKNLCKKVSIKTDYGDYGKIEYEIHRLNQDILHIEYGENIVMELILDLDIVESFNAYVNEISKGQCEIEDDGLYYVIKDNGDIILDKVKV